MTFRPIPRQAGFTFIEMMITVAIFSLMVVAIYPLIRMSTTGLTQSEALNSLKEANQTSINKIGRKLVECKRLFENSAGDTAFLTRLQYVEMPTPLVGSKLAIKEENGAISPSSGAFVSASVGNSLFIASLETPRDMDVLNASLGSTQSVRIDIYRFNYYYLAKSSGIMPIGNKPARNLWEWHSVTYADYNQIAMISDVTKSTSVIGTLASGGVSYAWDPSTSSVSAAFYLLTSSGTMTLSPGHTIPQSSGKAMVNFLSGIAAGSFRYGVCANTDAQFNPNVQVPKFATASSDFPSGFEVVTVGPSSARQVFIRIVLAAQGSFPGYTTDEQVVLASARDIW